MATSLGEFIRRRRTELGFSTQSALARHAGINSAHLSQIESGKIALPNADLRRKLAHALGITHVELLIAAGELATDEGDEAPEMSPAVRRLQPLIDQITWSERRFALVEAQLRFLGVESQNAPPAPEERSEEE